MIYDMLQQPKTPLEKRRRKSRLTPKRCPKRVWHTKSVLDDAWKNVVASLPGETHDVESPRIDALHHSCAYMKEIDMGNGTFIRIYLQNLPSLLLLQLYAIRVWSSVSPFSLARSSFSRLCCCFLLSDPTLKP